MCGGEVICDLTWIRNLGKLFTTSFSNLQIRGGTNLFPSNLPISYNLPSYPSLGDPPEQNGCNA